MKIDFQAFENWQKEKPTRTVHIELGGPNNPEYVEVFVYDYDLKVGQLVQSVYEIDLIAEKKKQLIEANAELEKLNEFVENDV